VSLEVLSADGLVTIQDRGRVGYAHLGVPRAGALDGPAADLANRLVGNPDGTAVLEVTLAGVELRTDAALTFAVTGAECQVSSPGRWHSFGEPVTVPAGTVVTLGPARGGVRSYFAGAGGVNAEPVLGSRSTDTLAFVGPPLVEVGSRLPVGDSAGAPHPLDAPRTPPPSSVLRVLPGPRLDWFVPGSLDLLAREEYVVGPDSNRVGLRLRGALLRRRTADELPSEGLVSGAVQVPPDGQPVVLLHDHPVTGGYPVIAVVDSRDLPVCAQLRPGESVRFRLRDAPAR
jgi:biotin-dependent carboxylase-like uncharacterized protein